MDLNITGYEIEEKIGEGGMAHVYRARHLRLERDVAIKVMRPQLKIDGTFSERFLREAKIAANLFHPNIIQIYDVDEVNEHLFLSMELVLGGDLSAKLNASRNKEEAITIFSQLCEALDYAHGEGYIHRDIKPGNILFRKNGSLALSDFGIARAQNSNTQMTQAGSIIGTPSYMSPEQAQGHEISNRSDLYSLGVVIYQYIVGQLPYKADSTISAAIKHVNEPIPQMPKKLRALQRFFDTALAKQAQDRFASGKELMATLEKGLTSIKDISIDLEATVVLKKSPAAESSIENNMPRIGKTEALLRLIKDYSEKISTQSAVKLATIKELAKKTTTNFSFPDLKKINGKTTLIFFLSTVTIAGVLSAIIYSELNLVPRKQPPKNQVTPKSKLGNESNHKLTFDEKPEARRNHTNLLVTDPIPLLGNNYKLPIECLSSGGLTALQTDLSLVNVLIPYERKNNAVDTVRKIFQQSLRTAEGHLNNINITKAEDFLLLAENSANLLQDANSREQIISLQKRLHQTARRANYKAYIVDLLNKGDRSRHRSQWYEPSSRNAWYYYSKVLETSPNHQKAKEGLEQVKQSVAELASTAISKNKISLGEKHLNFLKRADKSYSEIHYLEELLDYKLNPKSNKNREISRLYRAVGKELKASKMYLAAKNYKHIEKISPYHPLLRKLNERISHYYVERARTRIDRKDWQEAKKSIDSGLQYAPHNQKLQQLMDLLKQQAQTQP